VEWISKEDHKELATKLVKFVDTSSGDITSALSTDMAAAAEREEFEQAAKIRIKSPQSRNHQKLQEHS